MNINLFKTLFLTFFPLQLFCQLNITGTLKNNITNLPIEYATVYINGTTKGVISDTTGFFHLENIKTPCHLVVSHIGYKTQSVYLKDSLSKVFDIKLEEHEVELSPIDVSDINLRNKNLAFFKRMFLGKDVWGKYATIENENVLNFHRDYIAEHIYKPDDTTTIQLNTNDSVTSYEKTIEFRVSASDPLIVDLPLLGYSLNVNLVNFIWREDPITTNNRCSILGYYFFRQKPYESRRDSIRINKNRKEVFYHSQIHFGRSLYENKLAENGYQIYIEKTDSLNRKSYFEEMLLDSFINIHNDYVDIIGLKDKGLMIFYYQNNRKLPIDLNKNKVKREYALRSDLVFANDTCTIRKDGTVPDNSILFGEPIARKRIGALLPDNFVPNEK